MITQGEIKNEAGIYCIENVVNKKKYIGSAKNTITRLNNHNSMLTKNKHSNIILQRSFNKYGDKSFVFYPICYCLESELLQKEDEYIKVFNTLNREKGYNIETAQRTILSEETRKKISEARKGIKFSEEHKKNISLNHFKNMSKEAKINMSIAKKDKKLSEETRKKISISKTGKKFSEEHRKNISLAKKGITFSQESKRKMRISHYKKVDQLDLDGKYIKTFNSILEAAKELKINGVGNIGRVCNGKFIQSHGYKWRYSLHTTVKEIAVI